MPTAARVPGMTRQTISATVTAKGGYNTGADGVEDGSIYIESVPQGTTVVLR